MNETTLLKAKVNRKYAKGIFIFECVLCTPFVLCALLGIWIGLVFLAGPIWTYYCYRKTKDLRLVITNKRIVAAGGMFGSETNIPMDSVSAVSKGIFKSVKVTSSSGVIAFSFLENPVEVYNTINRLINTRTRVTDDMYSLQPTTKAETKEDIKPAVKEDPPVEKGHPALTTETMELLHNYKTLLDEGILTQEEFDEKKKQMLGL